MKVSVIVPLYNKAPTIQRTLDSVLGQTLADFELIVVDDGSTDGGVEIVERCGDPRVRLFRQANTGPGAARNRALREAKGEYAAFLDADDEWLPDFLKKGMALAEKCPEAAAVASGYVLDPDGRSTESMWRRRGLHEGIWRLEPDMPPQLGVYLLAYLSPCTTVARLEIVRRWGGFFSSWKCLYGEDSFLWLKVLLHESVVLNLEPLVRFHTEASALTKNLGGPRPVEPILLHPEELRQTCPQELKNLLEGILALHALKTACMLGYWGRWREGRALLHRFSPSSNWRRAALAQFVASPLGATAGKLWRWLRGIGLQPAAAP
jgi:glycosyltransferase involved in cell wall biosynthesis